MLVLRWSTCVPILIYEPLIGSFYPYLLPRFSLGPVTYVYYIQGSISVSSGFFTSNLPWQGNSPYIMRQWEIHISSLSPLTTQVPVRHCLQGKTIINVGREREIIRCGVHQESSVLIWLYEGWIIGGREGQRFREENYASVVHSNTEKHQLTGF